MTDFHINGIQQIGIGNNRAKELYKWYTKYLGMKVPVFNEEATASLMKQYTGGEAQKRHAILALNLQGGGGVEIWQFLDRKAQASEFDIQLGDLGILAVQYKSKDIEKSHQAMKELESLSPIFTNQANQRHFYCKDCDGNWINLVEFDDWFSSNKGHSGGICGATIGVTNLERSVEFYRDVLGYDEQISKITTSANDLRFLGNNSSNFESIMLSHKPRKKGAFTELLGVTQITLVETKDFEGRKIFRNRFWGDLGYIHLCLDVNYMDTFKKHCQDAGFPFQVDSGDFEMGEAEGRFAYIEDPDGTLIEFVETYKVPIIEKFNWYLNLRKRKNDRPLPRWMIKMMGV